MTRFDVLCFGTATLCMCGASLWLGFQFRRDRQYFNAVFWAGVALALALVFVLVVRQLPAT